MLATHISQPHTHHSTPSATMIKSSQDLRIHYLDNLRAIAMLLGVYLHAAFAYAQPAQTLWLATDRSSSVLVDASIWFIHLFRMSLFFVLSGYFAKWIIERKGSSAFLRGRILRVVVPFGLFYPFLLAAMTANIAFALSYLEDPQGLIGMMKPILHSPASTRRPEFRTMHLWFLYYLFAFSLVAIALTRAKGINFDRFIHQPVWLALLPFLFVPGVVGAGVPMPAPESFWPEWWPFAFYGLYFFTGWQLVGRETSLYERWSPYAWHLLTLSGLLFIGYYWTLPNLELDRLLIEQDTRSFWQKAMSIILQAYLSAMLTACALLLGRKYLSTSKTRLSLLSDASYWIYLTHLPIVLFLQTLLIPIAWPIAIKLTITILGTVLPCLATYLIFVRYTPLGWLLHGKRTFP